MQIGLATNKDEIDVLVEKNVIHRGRDQLGQEPRVHGSARARLLNAATTTTTVHTGIV